MGQLAPTPSPGTSVVGLRIGLGGRGDGAGISWSLPPRHSAAAKEQRSGLATGQAAQREGQDRLQTGTWWLPSALFFKKQSLYELYYYF